MADSINIPCVELVGAALEAVLWGVYFMLFVLSIWIMHQRSKAGGALSKTMVSITLLLFVVLTAHLILGLYHVHRAFIVNDGRTEAYLAVQSRPVKIAKGGLYSLSVIVMDAILIWRLYIIWDRSWTTITLPSLALLMYSAMTVFVLYKWATGWNLTIQTPAFIGWTTSAAILTVLLNSYASAFIAYRIVANHRALGEFGLGSSLMPVLIVLVESAAIYSFFIIITLVVLLSKSLVVFIMADIGCPIIGIVYSLIHIRLSLEVAERVVTQSVETAECRATELAAHPRPVSQRFSFKIAIEPHSVTSLDIEQVKPE